MRPTLTMVTVCFNAEKELEETISSVYEQDFDDMEYIIIDGCSTDNTLDIAEKYKTKFMVNGIPFTILSEPDKGIYDAMNKAIKLARGKWIQFLNAGDSLYKNNVLHQVFKNDTIEQHDIIYGNFNLLEDGQAYIFPARSLKYIKKELPFCHQASFEKCDILKKRLYDISYKICADYEHIMFLYQNSYRFLYISETFVNYAAGGFSMKNERQMRKELLEIQCTYGIMKKKSFRYWAANSKNIWKASIKKILPKKFIILKRKCILNAINKTRKNISIL